MHVSIHVSSVFHQVLDYLSPDLSSTPVAYYVDFADFINAIDFNIVPLCHSNTMSFQHYFYNCTLVEFNPITYLPYQKYPYNKFAHYHSFVSPSHNLSV